VVEDKFKEADGKAEQPRKRAISPIILVTVGAAIGGTGVVFVVPPRTAPVSAPAPVRELIDVQHPDQIELQCNPRVQAGKAFLSAGFYFVYRVREDREHEAFEQIKLHLDRARSNVLMLLKARTMTELNAENGQRVLAKDLVDELDAVLFPGRREDKVARVTEVLWSKWIVQ